MDKKNIYLHSFKKLDHKTFCASWAGLLLVLFFIMFTLAPYTSFYQMCLYASVPEVKNFDFETERLVTVSINRQGKVCIGGGIVIDISKLPVLVEDEIETIKSNKRDKVLLAADENVQYGKVQELLNLLAKADIRIVGLITKGCVNTADYIGNRVTIK